MLFILFIAGAFLVQRMVVQNTPAPIVVSTGMNDWNWVSTNAASSTASSSIQFMYPNPLPTKYVTAQGWPPRISATVGVLSCTQGTSTTSRVIVGHVYCVTTTEEGAAGSTYTTYEYATQLSANVIRATFVLRTVQCLNYDEPARSACTKEQAEFETDALADRIISSVRLQ